MKANVKFMIGRDAWICNVFHYFVDPIFSIELQDLLVKHGNLNFAKAKVKDAAGNPTGTFSASAANATEPQVELCT